MGKCYPVTIDRITDFTTLESIKHISAHSMTIASPVDDKS